MEISINVSAALLLVFTFTAIIGLLIFRKYYFLRVGEQGFIVLLGYVATFLIPASAWALGLSSAFNDPNNPTITGTGGYYGVNPRYFLPAMAVYIILPVLAILITSLFPRRDRAGQTMGVFDQIGRALKLERIGHTALIGASMLTIWYFYAVGLDRFWYSNLSRFEFEINVSQNIGLKIVLTFILAFGCLGAALAAFDGLFLSATCVVLISSLPFLAFASRGITVLAAAYCGALFFRMRLKAQLLSIVPMLVLAFLSLRLPLIMRMQDQTGLKVALGSVADLYTDKSAKLSDNITSSLLNVGQGFGLMVEEREMEDSGRNISEGIPGMYFLLSLSPTISAIDHFADKWLDYHPRQNQFTPYSGICELISKNIYFGLLLMTGIYAFSIAVCRRTRSRSLLQEAGLFAFALVIDLGFLQLQQYPLRTGMRFIYVAYVLLGLFKFAEFLAATAVAGRPMTQMASLFVRRNLSRRRLGAPGRERMLR